MSIFLENNHLFLRNPKGGVEDVVAMYAAGFGAIFCNIGDYAPDEWGEIRLRADTAGLICGPWLRTADASNNFRLDRLHFLIETADEWRSPFIVNSESELKGSGTELTSLIAGEIGERDAAISVESWPFANVGWWPLARYPFLPQIFPLEMPLGTNPEACREGWHDYGITCVVFTFGAYGTQKPEDYDRLSPYGVYTADDIGGNYRTWFPQGIHNPCISKPEDDMEKIGDQHGITAYMSWLRKQPNVPPRGPGYKPENIDTWPWPDKIERTLTILVDDHDEKAGSG